MDARGEQRTSSFEGAFVWRRVRKPTAQGKATEPSVALAGEAEPSRTFSPWIYDIRDLLPTSTNNTPRLSVLTGSI